MMQPFFLERQQPRSPKAGTSLENGKWKEHQPGLGGTRDPSTHLQSLTSLPSPLYISMLLNLHSNR